LEHHCIAVQNTPRPVLINAIIWLHAGRAALPAAA